ncbi:hypothetical protein MLD38_031652 [Melastoma candidum]|uniref:Uncharacterized protein n=1 Tax=Melastoma candidum TaxID=119954 RepID=A0ACB9MTN6_9MYRT|nr:hypothetical protein MLD38_031652 [Melastoma candidum]
MEEEVISLCSEFHSLWALTQLKTAAVDNGQHEKIKEDHLQSMPFLKAVVLEVVLPHVVRGCRAGRRFLDESSRNGEQAGTTKAFDITGRREIKMMPFGAGRRIYPSYGAAILQREYFLANLIWRYQGNAVDGDAVDLLEKLEFTEVMKKPLRVFIYPRLLGS